MAKKFQESGSENQSGHGNESINVRKPVVAGMFYPARAKELEEAIKSYLSNAPKIKLNGKLKGLVVPHAGYIYSGQTAACAYKLLQSLDQEKEWKIILLGPSHYVYLQGAACSGADEWEMPLGKIKTEEDNKIRQEFPPNAKAHFREHSLEVQIPFLQKTLKKFSIVPISYGEADPEELSVKIMKAIGENTIIIASSDLSHYYPYEEAMKLDSLMNKAVPGLDIEAAARGEACGLTGILSLMHIAKKMKWKGILLDYKNSGDTSGDMKQVVGYGAYAFYEAGK